MAGRCPYVSASEALFEAVQAKKTLSSLQDANARAKMDHQDTERLIGMKRSLVSHHVSIALRTEPWVSCCKAYALFEGFIIHPVLYTFVEIYPKPKPNMFPACTSKLGRDFASICSAAGRPCCRGLTTGGGGAGGFLLLSSEVFVALYV